MLGKISLSITLVATLGVAASLAQPGRFVGTPSDPWIPNFAHPEVAAGPVVSTVQLGQWSDPETWGGKVPGRGDVAVVEHDVLLAESVDVLDVVIYPGGFLRFQPDTDSQLTLGTLQVLEEGALEIGRAAVPIASDATAEVIFTDRAIDTASDPGQYGHGLLALGAVTIHGAAIRTNFARLSTEPQAGDLALALAEPIDGWSVGGRLVLPDTRQADPRIDRGFVSQTEVIEIAAVSASGSVTLSTPLAYDHLGARGADGELDLLPHAAYLSANVVLRSANPEGVRGHAQFLRQASVDVRYALFQDLGRTTAEELDETVFDAEGNATYVGTNQPGRYPIHAHHLSGPVTPLENGFQFAFVGNAIDGGGFDHAFKWGIAVHASHYGLVRGNTVYNYAGSGISTEDGSESANLFEHNFVARCSAFGNLDTQDRGTAGTAFWFRGQNNFVRGNVAADSRNSGFSINAYRLGEVDVPVAPGSLDRVTVDMNTLPILEFTDNESYGPAFHGFDVWEIGSTGDTVHDVERSLVSDLRIWHHYDRGLTIYRTHRITYDQLLIRGDAPQLESRFVDPIGVHLSDHYRLRSHTFTRADVQGQRVGIQVDQAGFPEDLVGDFYGVPAPQEEEFEVVIQDSELRNYTNLSVETRRNQGSPRRTVVCNTTFGEVGVDTSGPIDPPYDLIRSYNFGLDRNLITPDAVDVFSYNRDPEANFALFSAEQAPSFVVPQTSDDGRSVGSPEEGLTNEENWALYGIAVANEIAPCSDASTYPSIGGFTCPLDSIDDSQDVSRPTSPPVVEIELDRACAGEILLTWKPSCDDRGVVEYTVSRDGVDIGSTSGLSLQDASLPPGSYAYRVRARDGAGLESVPSTLIVAEIPGGC